MTGTRAPTYSYMYCVNVFVKAIDRELCSVKEFMDQRCSDVDDLSNVQLLLSVDKLPPNQYVMLQNLYEEVRDLWKDRQSQVDSVLECLENAELAYKVMLLYFVTVNNTFATFPAVICILCSMPFVSSNIAKLLDVTDKLRQAVLRNCILCKVCKQKSDSGEYTDCSHCICER